MLSLAVDAALALVALATVACFVRLAIGPSLADRILALDTLSIDAIAFLVLYGIRQASPLYFEVALLIAMLGFVGTVALARYVLRGDIVE
jgi:multicomponent K+:H+ antiporter subunit F